MTIAQHERIVAAKDAQLRELRDSMTFRTSLIGRLEAELEQLRAQPARTEGPCQKCIAPYDCSLDGCAFGLHRVVAQPARQVGDVQLTGEYHEDVNMLLGRISRQVGGDEPFARLNRRAIPVGLLETMAHCTEPDCCIAYERSQLRALLGKDG